MTGLQDESDESKNKKKRETNEKPLDTKMEDNYIDNVLDEFGHTDAERTAERLPNFWNLTNFSVGFVIDIPIRLWRHSRASQMKSS